ncbi:MAG: O-methyltransferase [Nocardioides sp.]
MKRSMKGSMEGWRAVDEYFTGLLVEEDDALRAARESSVRTALPMADVAPNQGAFLSLLARMCGARRVLEFGTLAGYSTIWLARAVGAEGRVVTLEIDGPTAEVARENFERADVSGVVDLVVGPAAASAQALVDAGAEPFDLVFIDADKPSNPAYLALSLRLSRPGTVIVCDNVVRNGAVVDDDSEDPRVQGVRAFAEAVAADPRLEATALQTVGVKGWDGFALLRVR